MNETTPTPLPPEVNKLPESLDHSVNALNDQLGGLVRSYHPEAFQGNGPHRLDIQNSTLVSIIHKPGKRPLRLSLTTAITPLDADGNIIKVPGLRNLLTASGGVLRPTSDRSHLVADTHLRLITSTLAAEMNTLARTPNPDRTRFNYLAGAIQAIFDIRMTNPDPAVQASLQTELSTLQAIQRKMLGEQPAAPALKPGEVVVDGRELIRLQAADEELKRIQANEAAKTKLTDQEIHPDHQVGLKPITPEELESLLPEPPPDIDQTTFWKFHQYTHADEQRKQQRRLRLPTVLSQPVDFIGAGVANIVVRLDDERVARIKCNTDSDLAWSANPLHIDAICQNNPELQVYFPRIYAMGSTSVDDVVNISGLTLEQLTSKSGGIETIMSKKTSTPDS